VASRPVLLGHGASGSAATMAPWVEGLADRGLSVETVPAAGKLPMRAEKAMEVYREQLDGRTGAVIGGVSYGGRVASMLAAQQPMGGVVLLSYPLHPPGKPDQQRVEHLASISCPLLFLSGEADPFARLDLLRSALGRLPRAELHTYPRVGHGLSRDPAVFADALGRLSRFIKALG
jgi:predicted alpha/beta-hydrolase family hydrolase